MIFINNITLKRELSGKLTTLGFGTIQNNTTLKLQRFYRF